MGQRELGKGYANFIKEISALILICNVLYPSPPHVVWYNLQVHNICEETCLNCVETISHNYYNLQLLLTKTVVSGHELTEPASIFIISGRQATFLFMKKLFLQSVSTIPSWPCFMHATSPLILRFLPSLALN